MEGRVPPERYPWWVKFGLIGASTRQRQWFFVWLSLLSAMASVIYGALNPTSQFGLLVLVAGGIGFPIAAAMYWLTIRWVDLYGTWE